MTQLDELNTKRLVICKIFDTKEFCSLSMFDSNFGKPSWTHGITLWGTASNSNIEILQRYQNKVRVTVNSPWYIPNKAIHAELNVPTVREEMTKFSVKKVGFTLFKGHEGPYGD
jgi:hypothetical protein